MGSAILQTGRLAKEVKSAEEAGDEKNREHAVFDTAALFRYRIGNCAHGRFV